MPDSLLPAALLYTRAGLSIMPLGTRSKFPDFEALRSSGNVNLLGQPSWHVFRKRLPSEDEMTAWFADGDRNLGILTGFRHLLVLDFDEPGLFDTWSAMNQRIAAHTSIQASARGFHVLLRWANVHTTWYYAGNAFKLLHARHLGGAHMMGAVDWIAAWPSIHPSGRRYQWLPGKAPWETGIVRIESLEQIGIEPVNKIPASYLRFLRNLLRDPRFGFPLLRRWMKHRFARSQGRPAP